MGRGNPTELFPTDVPVPAKELIGRADDITEIATQLQVGANVILAAPRRTGKTSVCDAVIERLAKDDAYYTVKVDLFGIADIDQLAERLIEETVKNRALLRKALFSAKKTGKTLYESISLTVGAKMAGVDGLDFGLLPTLRTDPVALLDYALDLPERIAVADGKRLVLFIDEFQNVEQIGENHAKDWAMILKKKMRTSFQRSSQVSFLFAGSLEHMMLAIFGGSQSEPFQNFGTFHDLSPILPEEWKAGLLARFKRDKTTIDPDALDLIVERGDQHPRSTMLIAQRAHVLSIISGTRHVTLGLVEAAYADALRSERQKHEAWVDRIQHIGTAAINRVSLRSIISIAREGAPYANARYPLEVTRALNALRDAGFIEKSGKQKWQLVDPLFRAYLVSAELP
jgi:hypothetical protein